MTDQQFDNLVKIACDELSRKDSGIFEAIETKDYYDLSPKLKHRMNRLFRVHVGGNTIPHPEVDNWFERLRAKIIKKALSLNFKPIIRIK